MSGNLSVNGPSPSDANGGKKTSTPISEQEKLVNSIFTTSQKASDVLGSGGCVGTSLKDGVKVDCKDGSVAFTGSGTRLDVNKDGKHYSVDNSLASDNVSYSPADCTDQDGKKCE